MTRGARILLIAAAATIAGVVHAPAASAAGPPAQGWVGEATGTRVFLGVVQRGDGLLAYACDGRRLGRWFDGRRTGPRSVLRDDRGRRLALVVRGRTATAVLDLPGRRAARVVLRPARGRAGLFRRERVAARASGGPATRLEGWVRLGDGRVRGLGLLQPLQARRPRPGVEVLLRAATVGTPVADPLGSPPAAARLGAAVADPCIASAPSCGLPAQGMRIGEVRRTARVRSIDADARLDAAALTRILGEAPAVRAREEAAILASAGITLPPITTARPPARNRSDPFARALIADAGITGAATALKLARTAEARSAAADLLARLGRRIPGAPLGPIDRPEVAIVETGGPGTLRAFRSETLTSGAAVTEEQTLEGPDAEVRDFRSFTVAADLAMLAGFARAGFHSYAEFTDRLHVEIVVPPGARQVEIVFDASSVIGFRRHEACIAGTGSGMTWRYVALWARDPDGTYHLADNALVDGIYGSLQFSSPPLPESLGSCVLLPPVPPAPALDIRGLPTLRIADPPAEGGRFLVTVEVGGFASTLGDGVSETEHRVGVSAITVRTEF